MVQDSINVLLREYIGMCDKKTAPFLSQRPKGLACVFISCLCPPTDALDLLRGYKLLKARFTSLSRLLVRVAFLLIPALLWLVRATWRDGRPTQAIEMSLAGLGVLLLAEALVDADWEQRLQRVGIFNGDSRPPPPRPAAAAPAAGAQSSSAAAPASGRQAAATLTRANGNVKATPAAAASPMKPKPGGGGGDAAARDKINATLAMLEVNLVGKRSEEQSAGARARLLCGHVGVDFPGGYNTDASNVPAEVILAVLVEIQAVAGL